MTSKIILNSNITRKSNLKKKSFIYKKNPLIAFEIHVVTIYYLLTILNTYKLIVCLQS